MAYKITQALAAALTIGALTACGGAGGSGSPAPPGSTTSSGGSPASRQTLPVSVSLFVPKSKSSSASAATSVRSVRKPSYLPSSVNSITIQQTESGGSVVTGAPTTVLVIGGPNCSASAGGQTCTLTLQGALGQDAWAISSFVTGNGTGPAISLNTGTLVVQSGVANVITLTLNPILASLTFVPLAYSANATTTSALPLVMQAKDTAGATIIGPGTFVTAGNVANPITLTSSSATHVVLETSGGAAATVTLTTTGSNNLAQIAYDGTLVAGSQTVTASATGITTATLTLTLTLAAGGLVVPVSIALGANLGTTSTPLAISEPGYGGTFTLTSSSCAGIVTFPGTAGPGPSTSPTVTQVGGGTCTILVSDGTNNGSVIVYSTTIGIILQ
jgi:hypothetical protein